MSTSTQTPAVVTRHAAPWAIAVALLLVYVIWGSTYLGIRVVVEDVPPLLGMGSRFLAAGLLLGALLSLRGGLARLRVSRAEWLGCAFLGLMLPVLGNGLVAVGESRGTPSGVAALLVATIPINIMLLRAFTGHRPGPVAVGGVVVGLVGVALLAVTSGGAGAAIPIGATLVVLAAASFWSIGSWYQPRLRMPDDALVATVHEMIVGGVLLLLLGALILDEAVTGVMLLGGGLIVLAVAVVISVERAPQPATADEAPAPEACSA